MLTQLSKESVAYHNDVTLAEISYLLIDVQATGASPRSAHILECAYQSFRFTPKQVELDKEHQSLEIAKECQVSLLELPPGIRLKKTISKLTGLKLKDLKQATKVSHFAHQLWSTLEAIYQEIQKGKPWVFLAHVARYERSFIRALCLAHLPQYLNEAEAKLRFDTIPWLCTHAISTRLYPSLPRRSLNAINAYFGGKEIRLKRALPHLNASRLIWKALYEVLLQQHISTWGSLVEFLSQSAKREQFKPSLPRNIRLEAPSLPGVYTFYDQRSTVVYVGRARNLNQRVNQHFRGQKGHDERHLELLGITHHVDWQTCASVLETKRLENQKIKTIQPRYNRALSNNAKPMYLHVRDFSLSNDAVEVSEAANPFIGPWVDQTLLERLSSFRAILKGDFSTIHRSYWPNQDLESWQIARTVLQRKLQDVQEQIPSLFPPKVFQIKHPMTTESMFTYLAWGQLIEATLKADISSAEKEETKQSDDIIAVCDLLMLQLWQTWRDAQWQNLLLQGEVIWLADTGRTQKSWRHLTLGTEIESEPCAIKKPPKNIPSKAIQHVPKTDHCLSGVKDLFALKLCFRPVDRLTYDQGRLSYLSLLSLSRQGIASYYRKSSQDHWFRLDFDS